jgi:arabinofuranan 3-O-arabinosyltransferase
VVTWARPAAQPLGRVPAGAAAAARQRPAGLAAALRRRLPSRTSVVVVLVLTALSFVQQPGRTTFDTKLDLVVNPAAFMARALHLWNPQATAGELQNQAYGYLFPVGPFFELFHVLGVPPWVAQRLWCAVLLTVAYAGTLLLARALRIGGSTARGGGAAVYAGALVYALAPRMLTEIGPLSVEMLPAAMLPWVLLPLVSVDRIGSPRRAAALSGLAVLCMSGVNAAMVAMALVVPGLYLLSRRWDGAHVRLVCWWVASVAGACLWWLGPLLLLGQYSPPFLDYIESAANTTAPVSLFEALRGTNQWVAYVVQGTPWWPGAWLLVDNWLMMIATVAVAVIGLLGLTRRALPERHFLMLGTLAGLALLTVAYVGELDSPLADPARGLLDGVLAPLRNVHKFDPGLRLCLSLAFISGIGLLVQRGSLRRRLRRSAGQNGSGGVDGVRVAAEQQSSGPAEQPEPPEPPEHLALDATQPISRIPADGVALPAANGIPAGVALPAVGSGTPDEPGVPGGPGKPAPDRLSGSSGSSGGSGGWRGAGRRLVRTVSDYRDIAVALVLIVLIAAPAWLLQLRPGNGWDAVPAYWPQAMNWLAGHDATERTLLLPATGSAEYLWGRTVDEPAQPLAGSPWAVRNQAPLGSEGNTRVMDTVDAALADGRGSPGLADYLARAGFGFLLLRNDIDRAATDAPSVAVLHAALAGSPGIVRVAGFGDQLRTNSLRSTSAIDDGPQTVPALEIYQVRGAVPQVSAVPMADTTTISGGPESILPMLEQGLITRDRPTLLAADAPPSGGAPVVVSDGLRRSERNVATVRDNLSQTMTADEQPRQNRKVLDVLPVPGIDHQTVASYHEVRGVSASSAGSYADAAGPTDPSAQPFAALDGDGNTAWRSASYTGPAGQWLSVQLDTPRPIDTVRLQFVVDLRLGWPPARIRIDTDSGSVTQDVVQGGGANDYPVKPGLTSNVKITVLSVAGNRTTGNVGIRELTIPGVDPQRALRVPRDVLGPDSTPAFSFSRGTVPRWACVTDNGAVRCDPALSRVGEEPDGIYRLFRTDHAGPYRIEAGAQARPNGTVPIAGALLTVAASSELGGDPAAGATEVIDGNPATAWVADQADLAPTLRLRWLGQHTLNSLQVLDAPRAGSAATQLELQSPAGTRLVNLDADGTATFDPLTTDQLDVVVRQTTTSGTAHETPVAISELTVPGLGDLLRPVPRAAPLSVPCGQGPAITLDGRTYQTSLTATVADLVAHRQVPVTLCGDPATTPVDLPAGEHEIRTAASGSFVVQNLALRPAGAAGATFAAAAAHRALTVQTWDSTHRQVRVGSGAAALLIVPENANSGWQAELDGRRLTATRVDGWQQAWQVPAGAGGTVTMTFAPDQTYRGSLAIGAAAAAVPGLLAVLPVRRPVRRRAKAQAGRAVQLGLVVLLGVLGGFLPVVALIACMLLRQLNARLPRIIALGAAAATTGIVVAGRLLGNGQSWAFGAPAQAGLLIAVAAVVATFVDPPGSSQRVDRTEPVGERPAYPAAAANGRSTTSHRRR